MFQWMTPHTCTNGQHKLALVEYEINSINLGGAYWSRQLEKELEWNIEVGTTLTHCVNV